MFYCRSSFIFLISYSASSSLFQLPHPSFLLVGRTHHVQVLPCQLLLFSLNPQQEFGFNMGREPRKRQLSYWQLPFYHLYFFLHQGDSILQVSDFLDQFRGSQLHRFFGRVELDRHSSFDNFIATKGFEDQGYEAFWLNSEVFGILKEAIASGKPTVLDVPMINNPTPTTGHWNILDIYSPDEDVSHVAT